MANTIQLGGSRFYVHPESAVKAPGVTSVVGMLPKPFLNFWNAKLVAEEAVDNLGSVVSLVLNGGREAAVEMLKGAPRRFTKKAADVGSDVHDLFEAKALGRDIGRVHPDYQPYVDHFDDFLQTVQPEFLHLEATVWSDSRDAGAFAGSFDAIAVIEGETVCVDWKTTRSGVHEEVGLQLSAYRHADYILGEDGEQVPLPATTGGAVMHVRPEGWQLVPARSGPEVFDYFLNLRRVFDWEKEEKRHVIGKPIFGSDLHVGASIRRGRK